MPRVKRENMKSRGGEFTNNKFPSDFYLEQTEYWKLYQEEKAALKAKYPPLDDMTREERRKWYKECLDLLIKSNNLLKAFEELGDRFQIYVHLPYYESIRDDRYDAIYRGRQGRKKRDKKI